jgi:DNA-binding MarR family transcriptional regulator
MPTVMNDAKPATSEAMQKRVSRSELGSSGTKRAVKTRSTRATELLLPSELSDAVGFRLRRAVNLAETLFAETFGPVEVTTAQYAILMSVRHNPGCQPSALAALLGITPNNLVPLIDNLVSRGFIRRSLSKIDRRIRHLRLTPSGEQFAAELILRHEAIRHRIEERMGKTNAVELRRLLELYSY